MAKGLLLRDGYSDQDGATIQKAVERSVLC